MAGDDECFGAFVSAFGDDFGHEGREEVDEGEGEEGEDDSGSEESEDEAAAVKRLVRHAEELEGDLDFFEDGVNGDVEVLAEEVSESFLGEDGGELGDGVGDPACGDGDGDVGAKGDGPEGGEDHLAGDRELGGEKADGEAGGDGLAAGVPELAFEDAFDRFLEPGALLHGRFPKEAVSLSNEPEVADFEAGVHWLRSIFRELF